MSRERWMTREERDAMRDAIAQAGGVCAWLRAAKPDPAEVKARHARLNALAVKCGLNPPYPEIDAEMRDAQ